MNPEDGVDHSLSSFLGREEFGEKNEAGRTEFLRDTPTWIHIPTGGLHDATQPAHTADSPVTPLTLPPLDRPPPLTSRCPRRGTLSPHP